MKEVKCRSYKYYTFKQGISTSKNKNKNTKTQTKICTLRLQNVNWNSNLKSIIEVTYSVGIVI